MAKYQRHIEVHDIPNVEVSESLIRNTILRWIGSPINERELDPKFYGKQNIAHINVIGQFGKGKTNVMSRIFEIALQDYAEYGVVRYLRDPTHEDLLFALTQGEPSKRFYVIVLDDLSEKVGIDIYREVSRLFFNIRHYIAATASTPEEKITANDVRIVVLFAFHDALSIPPKLKQADLNILVSLGDLYNEVRLADSHMFAPNALRAYGYSVKKFYQSEQSTLSKRTYTPILLTGAMVSDAYIFRVGKAKFENGGTILETRYRANDTYTDKDSLLNQMILKRAYALNLWANGKMSDTALEAFDQYAYALREKYKEMMLQFNEFDEGLL